jgi:hypothetical protein
MPRTIRPPHHPLKLTALDSCEVYSVPLRLVSRIPVVRWKLFEAFRNTHPYAAPRYRGTPPLSVVHLPEESPP